MSDAVSLVEITALNVDTVRALATTPAQESFVAPNARSIEQYEETTDATQWAIAAGDELVGYVLLSTKRPRYYLWRFMVDARHQGNGYGRAAMELLIDHVRALPEATQLFLSYVPEEGGPEPFYKGLGFVDTGREHKGELEAVLDL